MKKYDFTDDLLEGLFFGVVSFLVIYVLNRLNLLP